MLKYIIIMSLFTLYSPLGQCKSNKYLVDKLIKCLQIKECKNEVIQTGVSDDLAEIIEVMVPEGGKLSDLDVYILDTNDGRSDRVDNDGYERGSRGRSLNFD